MGKAPRLVMVGLLTFLAMAAIGAGYGFVTDPDGSSVGIPQDWLESTPFDSYLAPGLILGGMGVLSLAGAWFQFRASCVAPWWSGTAAAGFVIWIVVQAAWMGSFRHPMQTILQALVLAMAITIGALSHHQLRPGPAAA